MITNEMKRYLEKMDEEKSKKLNQMEIIKRAVYLERIQKRLDRELDNLYWLCKNHPQVFLGSYRQKGEENSHKRLKKILLCVKALNPKMEVELVLRNLKDEPEPKKEIRLIDGSVYQLKDNETAVPYKTSFNLEGLNIAKEEKIQIPLAELKLAKKETVSIPFKVEGKKEKPICHLKI